MDDQTLLQQAVDQATGAGFAIWYLIGAALVFFMQAGFAMVETGFTRAKNAGNIIMKNLMDFCIGTVVFIALGSGILLGENALMGFIGKPNWQIFTDYKDYDFSGFVFNLVFCATAATIVSGAMAERTRFISYCVYSALISIVVYPVEAHWIWGGGWLYKIDYIDFAGSSAIHMVGGLAALIGAAMVGPRIGKFEKDKNGKITKVNAFPGHSLTIGALGVFILWFGWYGFNGAAAKSVGQLGSIFLTTTIAPAVATVVCMIFTWVKYGKPDVSMCLNASLAGLVGITAGCACLDAIGSIIVGIVSGLIIPFGVWFCDYVIHVDDPVGAVAVHFMNGIWGGIAVGLFANPDAPGADTLVNSGKAAVGLFYGGGFHQLGIQLLGIVCILAWTAITMFIVYKIIDLIFGLRAKPEEEIIGLDIGEHGLQSAYADFMPSFAAIQETSIQAAHAGIEVTGDLKNATKLVKSATAPAKAPESAPIKTSNIAPSQGEKITKLSIICNQNKLEALQEALSGVGVTGITVSQVLGYGTQKGHDTFYRGVKSSAPSLRPKVKVEAVISSVPVDKAVEAAKNALYTGNIGDGKLFVYNVEDVVRVRTGETGYDALQQS